MPSHSEGLSQVLIERILANIDKVIVGKRESAELAVIALLCGGHVLLEDVPGVGKTTLVRTIAKTVGCDFRRIQFTPDLLPSDVTGVSVYNQKTGEFEFRPGPIFAQIVLADELNRTPPKTQAALLEAMEERQVTADGGTYRLPEPFIVLATQNPVDFDGTYRLPEAQLDRFLLSIRLGYPTRGEEVELLGRLQEQHPVDRLKPAILSEELLVLQRQVRGVHVDEAIRQYIVSLTSATRQRKDLQLGASPRASLALMLASQARAVLEGRSYVIPDDVKVMAVPVISHRLLVTASAALAGSGGRTIVEELLRQLPVPGIRYAAGR